MNDIVWGIVAIALTIAVAVFFPLGLVILAPVLLFGGMSARRRSHNVATKAIANGAIVGGIAGIVLIVVVVIVVGFSLTTNFVGESGSSASTAVPGPIRPAPTPIP